MKTEDEDVSQHSKEVAKGSLWGLAGSIFLKFVSFFYAILLARVASADDIGTFYLALSILGIVLIFSDLGLPASLQRYVPYFEGKDEKRKISSLLKANYLIVSILSIIATILVWWQADTVANIYQNAQLGEALRIISTYLLLQNIFRINTLYLQGRRDIKAVQYLANLQTILKLVLTLILFYLYGPTLAMISVAFVLSFLIATLFSFQNMRKDTSDLPQASRILGLELDKGVLSEVVPFGVMLTILGSFWVIISSSDRILLGYLMPPSQAPELVAIYSMATNVAYLLLLFPSVVEGISFPILSNLIAKNQQVQMRAVIETSQRWTLFILIPFAIVLILFSEDILRIFYGPLYGAGALAMAIILFGLVIRSLSSILALTLAAMRKVDLELKIAVLVAVVNVIFNVLLIPLYGIEGSALATLISFVFMSLLFVYYSRKLFGFRFSPEIYKLMLAGLLAFALVFLIKPMLSEVALSLPSYLPGFGSPGVSGVGSIGSVGSGDFQVYLTKIIYLAYLGFLTAVSVVVFVVSALLLKCLHSEDVVLMKKTLQKFKVPQSVIAFAVDLASCGIHS